MNPVFCATDFEDSGRVPVALPLDFDAEDGARRSLHGRDLSQHHLGRKVAGRAKGRGLSLDATHARALVARQLREFYRPVPVAVYLRAALESSQERFRESP